MTADFRPAPNRSRGTFLMMFSAAMFTANVLLVRALGEMHAANVWLVSCARFVVGLVLVATVYPRDFAPRRLVTQPKLVIRGVLGGIGVYLTYLTVVKIGAGRATFIGNTYVIWGALLAAWMLREKLAPSVLVGGVAAVAGLALLTGVFSGRAHPGLYDFLALVGALLSAIVVVTIRQLHATEHTATIFAAQCAYGLVLCLGPGIAQYAPLPPLAWVVIVVASLSAGTAQLAMTQSFRDLPVADGSLLQMLVPLGTAAGGMAFFHERFTARETVGAGLILAGTAFTLLRQPPATAAAD